jgi:hypothetical protein
MPTPQELAAMAAQNMAGYQPNQAASTANYNSQMAGNTMQGYGGRGESAYGKDYDPYQGISYEGTGPAQATGEAMTQAGQTASSSPSPIAQGVGAGLQVAGMGMDIYANYKAEKQRLSRQAEMDRLAQESRVQQGRESYNQGQRENLGDLTAMAGRADANEQYRQNLAAGYNQQRVL